MKRYQTLSISLLRGETEKAHDFIKPRVFLDHVVKDFELRIGDARWTLFIKKPKPKFPDWAEFFEDYVPRREFGLTANASAALLAPVFSGWCAVTFGQGRHMLKRERIVEDFGLRVTLNAVDPNNLRSMDKETHDAIAGQTRQQATREVKTSEFGLDIERDLLREVTGRPRDSTLGERLSGKDALSIRTQTSLEELEDLLLELDLLFESKDYQKSFSWVDKIRVIKNPKKVDELDGILARMIESGEIQQATWLSPPDVLNWSKVRFFTYSEARNAKEYTDIEWRTFLKTANRSTLDLDSLRKRRKVFCWGENGEVLREWPLHRCIFGEVSADANAFVISGGRWFGVDPDFAAKVERYCASITNLPDFLPVYKDDSEDEFLSRVADTSSGRFALLHKELVYHGGGSSSEELCDLLSINRDLVHVKRFSGSSELSHLFFQGLNSAQLLKLDREFRSKAADLIPASHASLCDFENFQSSRFRVVFVMIRNPPTEPKLPFFAQLSLRHVSKRLSAYGYQVALSVVGVDEIRALLETTQRKENCQVPSVAG